MIRIKCPGCGSKLDAKDELAGQTRNCPRCVAKVFIAARTPEVLEPSPAPAAGAESVQEAIPRRMAPDRLNRGSRYFICDRTGVVATWQNDGHGWMVWGDGGFVRAFRNVEKIPSQGDFRLVELRMSTDAERVRICGLRVLQLAPRWALVQLARGDDAILKSVTGPAGLLREQKNAVREHVKDQFTYEVWDAAPAVRDYLSNDDFHSAEVAEA